MALDHCHETGGFSGDEDDGGGEDDDDNSGDVGDGIKVDDGGG